MTIKQKLFLLIILPTLTILLFSINHTIDKYDTLQDNKALLLSTKLLEKTSKLLHSIQLEDAYTSAHIKIGHEKFKNQLAKHKADTDLNINRFMSFLKNTKVNFLTFANKLLIDDIKYTMITLSSIRNKVIEKTIKADDAFTYYTYLNSKFIELSQDIKLYSENKETYYNIMILKKLLSLRENSAQERALAVILAKQDISPQGMRKFYNLIEEQHKELTNIKNLVKHTDLYDTIVKIRDTYKDSYLYIIRQQIKNNNEVKKDIDSKLWIDTTTKRINDYYTLEYSIFLKIQEHIQNRATQDKLSLVYYIVFTTIIIFILLLGAYLIAKDIKRSINNLSSGLNGFFDFLNFKNNEPSPIDTQSNDELNEMAKKINAQIIYIKMNLQDDINFINETTKITQLMKDGNFDEHIFFEPSNPSLVELKVVFNELIYLITSKIQEQTISLQKLNSTLEDKVHLQTLELKKQLVTVTESRDKAIKAQKSKDEFLANMSHEIRTPLNAILGFVSILKKRTQDEQSIEYLSIIHSSGQSLLSIINDILDFSKIQSGKFTITPKTINPMLVLSSNILLFSSKAYEKNLIYAVYIDPNLPESISIDDTRLNQILSNLLSNAIKFTKDDGVIKVKISTKGLSLIVSVQDTGIGISSNNLNKIFNSFEQADGSTTRQYEGTGLGLAISLRLANLMGGTLKVKSIEGRGSTFTLKVPIDIINDSTKRSLDLDNIKDYRFAILNTSKESKIFFKVLNKYLNDMGITSIIEINEYQEYGYDILFFVPNDIYNENIVEANIPAIAVLRSNQVQLAHIQNITSLYAPFFPISIIDAINKITIQNIKKSDNSIKQVKAEKEQRTYRGNVLVVEDNKENQMLIALILFEYGLGYEISSNGKEAVKAFKEQKFDLVFMDKNMPILNGSGAVKQIKEYEKQNSLKNTPIIALSAAVLQTDIDRFLDEGMDGFVAKPIDTEKLEIELDKYLKRV